MNKRLLLLLALGACAAPHDGPDVGPDPLVLQLRSRNGIDVVEQTVRWDPRRTAVVVCDMWDDHWCAGAAARVGELAVPMNAMLETLRERGVLVIHAPSSVTRFYTGTPARRHAQEASFVATPVPLSTAQRWGTGWCWPDPEREPELPIDDTDMGCDCDVECTIREAWTRQHPALRIDWRDALTDHGQETWNLLREHDIEHVAICGVHLNMCVLGRPFGIRQLVHLGVDVALVRDLTDSMYDSDQAPHVDHFRGHDLVIEHVERHWCPSFLSSDVTGASPFRFGSDVR